MINLIVSHYKEVLKNKNTKYNLSKVVKRYKKELFENIEMKPDYSYECYAQKLWWELNLYKEFNSIVWLLKEKIEQWYKILHETWEEPKSLSGDIKTYSNLLLKIIPIWNCLWIVHSKDYIEDNIRFYTKEDQKKHEEHMQMMDDFIASNWWDRFYEINKFPFMPEPL